MKSSRHTKTKQKAKHRLPNITGMVAYYLKNQPTSLKWSFDEFAQIPQWYTGESVPWANDGYTIYKKIGNKERPYELTQGHIRTIGRFKKLSIAKMVAHHLRFG